MKIKNRKLSAIQHGFTLIELIVITAIFTTLLGFMTLNFLNVRNRTSITAELNSMIAELKEQQIRAMVGDTAGSGTSNYDYGIHFETTSYTLFRSTYGTSNFVINLPST